MWSMQRASGPKPTQGRRQPGVAHTPVGTSCTKPALCNFVSRVARQMSGARATALHKEQGSCQAYLEHHCNVAAWVVLEDGQQEADEGERVVLQRPVMCHIWGGACKYGTVRASHVGRACAGRACKTHCSRNPAAGHTMHGDLMLLAPGATARKQAGLRRGPLPCPPPPPIVARCGHTACPTHFERGAGGGSDERRRGRLRAGHARLAAIELAGKPLGNVHAAAHSGL